MTDISNMRREYAQLGFSEAEAAPDPVAQFRKWFAEALEVDIPDPTAMTLATSTAGGHPSARTVLLKDVNEEGFAFYSNYDSRKAREMDENPHASLVFWWQPLDRQVRIEGEVSRLSGPLSDAYFALRPRGSQISAWASPQSDVMAGREALEQRGDEVRARYQGEDIPRPPNWGGYVLQPHSMEFWQGRPDRLHDRLRYSRAADGWKIERLAP